MESLRKGFSLASGLLPSGLNAGIAPVYMDNLGKVLTFYEASDDNNSIINYNINKKREERYDKIEESKHIQEIVQKVIAGTCICVAATAAVASGFVTAGTSTAIALTALGIRRYHYRRDERCHRRGDGLSKQCSHRLAMCQYGKSES